MTGPANNGNSTEVIKVKIHEKLLETGEYER